jgi:hypothetical protein
MSMPALIARLAAAALVALAVAGAAQAQGAYPSRFVSARS